MRRKEKREKGEFEKEKEGRGMRRNGEKRGEREEDYKEKRNEKK